MWRIRFLVQLQLQLQLLFILLAHHHAFMLPRSDQKRITIRQSDVNPFGRLFLLRFHEMWQPKQPIQPIQYSSLFQYQGEQQESEKTTSGWQGFNPLSRTSPTSQHLIMRKLLMQELTQEMMRNIDKDEKLQSLLHQAKQFLLEPLDSNDAVLDPDSIYDIGMSRAQRYERYRTVMSQRINSATNPSLKKMLQAMMDYVLQFE